MRKWTNALRRRYQRKGSNELRENRKTEYTKANKEYQVAIKREKNRSWKQYCTTISPNSAWNEVYKLTDNKTQTNEMIKSDGTKPENMIETLQLMMDQLILEDKHKDDTTTTTPYGYGIHKGRS
jgi:hypothetical protein